MEERFGLDVPGRVRAEHARKDFLRRLHEPLGPASLLRLKSIDVYGKLGGAFDLREIEKFPTAKLCAIGKVGVFGEGVVLPAAGVGDGRAAPDTGRAVEIEEGAAAGARAVLDDRSEERRVGKGGGSRRAE